MSDYSDEDDVLCTAERIMSEMHEVIRDKTGKALAAYCFHAAYLELNCPLDIRAVASAFKLSDPKMQSARKKYDKKRPSGVQWILTAPIAQQYAESLGIPTEILEYAQVTLSMIDAQHCAVREEVPWLLAAAALQHALRQQNSF